MNREIKFRFWDNYNKTMYYRDLYFFEEEGIHTVPNVQYDVMQYTGLKDCKGQEIYEGDVVKSTYTAYQGYAMPRQVIEDICEVRYGENMQLEPLHWRVGDNDKLLIEEATFEVIGNIYEDKL